MASVEWSKGLDGVIAADTRLSRVDGENGKLMYLGYTIEDLAAHSDYEEVTYLLLYGSLPTRNELDAFRIRMRSARFLPRSGS